MIKIIYKFFSFLLTAPKVVSDVFLKLEKIGKKKQILEAIDDQRHKKTISGKSKDGSITVTKV
jgi:hypothetical protein